VSDGTIAEATDLVEVRRGVYHDSVSLMRISQALTARPGVEVALVAMATDLNLDLARDLRFDVPECTSNDLLVAIRATSPEELRGAAEELERQFAALAAAARRAGGGTAAAAAPRTTRAATRLAPDAVVLVSVPGEHAFAEAMDAVAAGRPVMIFSDNVPVEQEVALKRRAEETGALVLGPDCGTAVIGGVGLGFANVLRPGPVGVVAASGTGAQQVTTLLDHAGVGVSHVLGVGGRDLSAEVGGLSTLRALQVLDEDPGTELILLISKPPAPEVAEQVRAAAAACRTPVVTALLGPDGDDLTAAAEKALRALGREVPEWPSWAAPAAPSVPAGGTLRGLYAGGTLCAEAELIVPGEYTDFGDDEYTRGRPHPMIDPSLRLEALERTDAAVILLDVVLGLAADPDPAARLAPAIRAAVARGAAVVVALVGTEADPQGLHRQAAALQEAGAAVFLSNAAAARHAAGLLGREAPAPAADTPAAVTATGGKTDGGKTDGAASGPLPSGEPKVISVGTAVLAEALDQQAVEHVAVDWRPPLPGTAEALARVLADPRREEANRIAVERMTSARPMLVGVRRASEVLDLEPGTFFHAGPPITWERASGPMRGALIGAMLFEGLAADPEEAEKRLAKGDGITLDPCHHHRTVGPMAGVVSPSMWMFEVQDAEHGGTAYCSLNEGLGKVLRYGAYGPEVIERLRWMSEVLGPVLAAALERSGPIDLRALIAQALQMGDELHNRNRAATSLLVRELAPAIVEAAPERAAEVLRFINGNDHFFLNPGMAAAKVSADAARGVPGSTMVVCMARNGTDFGIQVSGLPGRWFTGPAGVPDGLYLGAYGPDDANPDIGDSTITETAGLGGFAMAAAPAIVRFVGGEVSDAIAATTSMYEITLAEHPAYQIPGLGFRGTPVGIDVTLVARTGLLPVVNTGIAGKVPGTGQVGAGLVKPPAEAFVAALNALAIELSDE
jgi:succinyl-CoA synthetase alpha subunit